MIIPLGDNLERPNFPVATVALIVVNVMVFAMTFKADLTAEGMMIPGEKGAEEQMEKVEEFYGVWGCAAKSLASGEIIGLITHMFIHASIAHLIGNMIILWAFGQSLETALGSFAFIVMYMVWGVVACLTQCMVDWSSEIFLVGASGAIAGVIGAYVMLLGYSANIKLLLLLITFPVRFEVPAIYVGAFWFLSQLMNASVDLEGTISGVAYMAHIGGFAIGVLTLLIYRNQTDRVLVKGHNNQLFFHDRSAVEASQQQEEDKLAVPQSAVSTGVAQSGEISIEPRECTACATQLDQENLIGECLLRCPNPECGQLAYITADEITSGV